MKLRTLLLVLSVLIACREEDNKDTATLPDDTNEAGQDADGDGYSSSNDCNDNDASIHPDARERCDDIDNDCDSLIDDEDPDIYGADTWYGDSDQDGYGADLLVLESCEQPVGYTDNPFDCNDLNASVNPDADEVCDGADNDCDGTIDEEDAIDATGWFEDTDGDGYGAGSESSPSCSPPAGYVFIDGDCDDTDPTYHPGATEADCSDPNDYNCDGSTGFADADADGFAACEDCNDTDANANEDAAEVCDGLDNDCDGDIDDADGNLVGATTFYGDSDGDGYGGSQYQQDSCSAPPGYVSTQDDCDDLNAASHPGASEICDGLDNDCDSDIDEGVGTTWYADSDSDGYGNGSVSTDSCDAPSGYVGNALDCDDFNAATNPSAYEICDSSDNDCDGLVDEQGAINATSWYADNDSDGYGSLASTQVACDAPSGHVENANDCNDADSAVNPGADEVCDSVDNNCDGTIDEDTATDATTWYADTDSDTFGNATNTSLSCNQPANYVSDATDCNDTAANAYPGANEVCDAIDNNCDGTVDEDTATDATTWYADTDSDTFGDALNTATSCSQPTGFVANSTDCNDSSASANPNETEVCDGIDNNCDGNTDEGVTGQAAQCPGTSCLTILNASSTALQDGTYYIDPDSTGGQAAYCDMTTDGGGWTLAMRRTGAEFQETWMVNTWGSGTLPNQSNTNDESWKVPDSATRIRFAFNSNASNTPTDYTITDAPGDPNANTGMWFTSPGTGDYPVTLYTNNVQGLSDNGSSLTWNFKASQNEGDTHGCYGVSNNRSYSSSCDHTNDLFGAIYDGCPGTSNSEVYIGTRKNITGNGAGGSYCTEGDNNARWWVWWRDD